MSPFDRYKPGSGTCAAAGIITALAAQINGVGTEACVAIGVATAAVLGLILIAIYR